MPLDTIATKKNGITMRHESLSSVDAVVTELLCVHCQADLARSSGTRCPECGVYFDAATLSRRRNLQISRDYWPPSIARIAVVVVTLPVTWLSTAAVQLGDLSTGTRLSVARVVLLNNVLLAITA